MQVAAGVGVQAAGGAAVEPVAERAVAQHEVDVVADGVGRVAVGEQQVGGVVDGERGVDGVPGGSSRKPAYWRPCSTPWRSAVRSASIDRATARKLASQPAR